MTLLFQEIKNLDALIGHLCRCANNASNRPLLISSVVAAIIEFRIKGFSDGMISAAILSCQRESFSLIPTINTLFQIADRISDTRT